jgi:ribonuclease T2
MRNSAMKRTITCLIILGLSLSGFAASGKHRKGGTQAKAAFDYYLLSLSWAPNYCADHPSDKSSECKSGTHAAFVLHGLWPNTNQGAPPMSCQPASPVAAATVRHMLEYFPSKGLIQHEWEKHGTCVGLSQSQYFAKVEQAYKAVKVPDRYSNLETSQQISVQDIELDFAKANNAPREAFLLSCHAGALVALEVCLDKDLHYQACPKSARECPNDQVELEPVR